MSTKAPDSITSTAWYAMPAAGAVWEPAVSA
jgi:hypothetical protein